MTNPLVTLQSLGQSPWHDNIRRGLLSSGALEKMVQAGDITGLTSNPTIFEQAIGQSTDYTAAIAELARQGKKPDEIFDQLSTEDIRAAADVFKPVYDRTDGIDGYVSIEVSPRHAHDTQKTIVEARRLWQVIDRPNLMIKIPATPAGLPAIQQCIANGMNVNVTLIFSLQRYSEVIDVYIAGLEERLAMEKSINRIASVASFFVSRLDSLVDKLLDEKIKTDGSMEKLQKLKGQVAIANAKLAYAEFKQKFATQRFQALIKQGARVQRPLWASTSSKNPAYPDVYYVEALIGSDTVNTMPPKTILAYKDHGQPAIRLEENIKEPKRIIRQLESTGILMDTVTQQLEVEGVESFSKSFDSLMAVVTAQHKASKG